MKRILACCGCQKWLVLGLVLLATFLLKLRHLDHTALTLWDEVFHAVVAQNLLKHPLKPTLIDVPYLPYQKIKWDDNHVWLHKPTLPLWQSRWRSRPSGSTPSPCVSPRPSSAPGRPGSRILSGSNSSAAAPP